MNVKLSYKINLKYVRLLSDNLILAMQLLQFVAPNYMLTWVVTK